MESNQISIHSKSKRDQRQRERRDSGYSEEIRRPIYKSRTDDAHFDFLELQASLISVSQDRDTLEARANRPRCRCRRPSKVSRQASSQAHQDSSTRSYPPKSTSKCSSARNSVHGKSSTSNSTPSIRSLISAQDSCTAYQKAQEIVQALEVSTASTESSTPTTRSSSLNQINETQSLHSTVELSLGASHPQLDKQQSSQFAPLYTATNIDWTDPLTRREAYEKHDRSNRGVRRLLKKITPRRWQSERLDFYDGASDAGSVRRYRLDI